MLRQKGMSLIELMVAMVISLIASMAMVMLMANTLGTGTRTIGMTRLTDQLRTAMQIMTRDLRRANYLRPEDSRTCFRNVDCVSDLGFGSNIGVVQIGSDSDGDGFGESLSFWMDRHLDGSFDECDQGAFRLSVSSGIGSIEMYAVPYDESTDSCTTAEASWVRITDPTIIDVQSFVVDNSDTYTETITEDGSTQTVQKIRLSISADLINNGTASYTISRTIGDEVRVRNNFTTL